MPRQLWLYRAHARCLASVCLMQCRWRATCHVSHSPVVVWAGGSHGDVEQRIPDADVAVDRVHAPIRYAAGATHSTSPMVAPPGTVGRSRGQQQPRRGIAAPKADRRRL